MTQKTLATAQEKAIEILENYIKTGKLFTAFHITATLRKCQYSVHHYEIRDTVNSYDIVSKNYARTLSSNGLFKVAAFIYHPVGIQNQEILDFEKTVADLLAKNKENTPVVSSVAKPIIPKTSVAIQPVTTSAPVLKPVSAIHLKSVDEEIEVKVDHRGRFCIPARIVRKYFLVGDKIGVFFDDANVVTAFEKYIPNNASLYSTTLTVDSYSNIRVPVKYLSFANGKVSVEYADRQKQIYLREV